MKLLNLAFGAVALASAAAAGVTVGPDEIHIDAYDVPEDCVRKAEEGDFVKVHYTASIHESSENGEKGKEFAHTRQQQDRDGNPAGPTEFQVGGGVVIVGLHEGVLGMCEGEKRRITIPPEKAYGDQGDENHPVAGATLHYDLELMSITHPDDHEGYATEHEKLERNIWVQIDTNKDGYVSHGEISARVRADKARGIAKRDFEKHSVEELSDIWFNREDKNKDGKVSWDEFSGPKGRRPKTEL